MHCSFKRTALLIATLFIAKTQCATSTLAQTEACKDEFKPLPYYSLVEFRQKFIDAKPGIAKGQAARQPLKGASPEDIRQLRFDSDDGVALCGAWYRLEVQMVARLVSVDTSASVVGVPDMLTREFLSFVEGRLKVPAPDGWAGVVRGVRSFGSGLYQFPVLARAMKVYEREFGKKPFGFETGRVVPPIVRLASEDGVPVLRFYGSFPFGGQDARAIVPDELQAEFDARRVAEAPALISGISVADRAIVALRGINGPGGEVYCITTVHRGQKPAVLWKVSMDAYWSGLFKGSEWFTELSMKDDEVFLFHGTHTSVGIEGLSFADGKRRFSFSTRLPELYELPDEESSSEEQHEPRRGEPPTSGAGGTRATNAPRRVCGN